MIRKTLIVLTMVLFAALTMQLTTGCLRTANTNMYQRHIQSHPTAYSAYPRYEARRHYHNQHKVRQHHHKRKHHSRWLQDNRHRGSEHKGSKHKWSGHKR